MTGRTDRGRAAVDTDGDVSLERRDRAASVLSDVLADREATAFVHVGTDRDPGIRYCRSPLPNEPLSSAVPTAVAYDGVDREWLVRSAADDSGGHPADRLAADLRERGRDGTLLTPARIPHDAALYLENAGFDLASTDALERARAVKTDGERERVAAAQRAASAGIRRAASILADTTVVDGELTVATDGSDAAPERLTPARLRTAIDEAVVAAGAFPDGNTAVNPGSGAPGDDTALRPGDPIVLETAPREPAGYYGGLVRTLVVDADGGRERRVHVAVTQSFRSARSMLTAGPESVTAVAADLEAEVRSFGFGDGDAIETRITGVGLEPSERPSDGGDALDAGTVARLDVAARVDGDDWLRIADVVAVNDEGERPEWLAAPSQSLEPAALLE
ncbi:M24 family metallopeptidase [Natrinema sp. 1APR25-10V2]|uniref:M24 family metallopeptidase n=1 Tax=Natrinema sp. 1APR25-10V2 TaxID=2951081 RepID=UPI0028764050|nr:M24 family metallopeptidase [Natrinema sp. 1APR25-10V2]MDS0476631.1 M24 family metallopeptidase [Natrinema sp. 1APR25-10V2]